MTIDLSNDKPPALMPGDFSKPTTDVRDTVVQPTLYVRGPSIDR